MEFTKVITERNSCKKYDGRAVEKEKLEAILKAGQAAPTAKNGQEQHIYVLQSSEALAKIDEVTICRYNAGTVLVVAYDKTKCYPYPGGRKNSGDEDATIVATHMILAACNEGVESCWVNNFDPDVLHEKLDLPENEEILMIMDLGYRAADAVMNPNHGVRKELSETVTYI